MPPNAVPDTYEFLFIYEKGGENKEFSMSHLPDSTWTYVDRKQKLIKQGKDNIPAINDFNLTDASGKDVTAEILNQSGTYYLLFLKEVPEHSKTWQKELVKVIGNLSAPVYVITAERLKQLTF